MRMWKRRSFEMPGENGLGGSYPPHDPGPSLLSLCLVAKCTIQGSAPPSGEAVCPGRKRDVCRRKGIYLLPKESQEGVTLGEKRGTSPPGEGGAPSSSACGPGRHRLPSVTVSSRRSVIISRTSAAWMRRRCLRRRLPSGEGMDLHLN